MENIRLAERLGAETVALTGDDVAEEIVNYARSQNVTTIVIGKSGEPRWRSAGQAQHRGSVASHERRDRHLRHPGYGRGGRSLPAGRAPPAHRPGDPTRAALASSSWPGSSPCCLQRAGLSEANKAVVFLLAVVLAAVWWGLWPGIVAAVASVLASTSSSSRRTTPSRSPTPST